MNTNKFILRTSVVLLTSFLLIANFVFVKKVEAQTSPLSLPLFDSSQIKYVGKFNLNAPPYGGAAVGVSENGKYIYTSCWVDNSGSYVKGYIATLQIPPIGGTGQMIQPCQAGITNSELIEISNDPGAYFPVLGSILENNARFVVGGFITYDAVGLFTPRKTFWSGTSLGNLVGPYEGTVRNGLVKGQSGIIPPEWRTLLGGDSYVGAGYSSIVSRSSYGPAFTSFNSADVTRDGFQMNFLLGCPYYEPGTTNYLAKCDTRYGSPQSIINYNGSEQSGGAFFVPGTRTLVAIEREALGPTCYGYATRNQADHGKPYLDAKYCYSLSDPLNQKGPLGYPYQLVAKLYDLKDLVDVKNGVKKAWDVDPYSVVNMPNYDGTPEDEVIGYTGGGVFNPVTGQYYLTREMNTPVDVFGGFGSGNGGGGGGGDTISPSVSISSPASGSTVSGTSVNLSANASDNVSVSGVQFKVDGINVGSEDTSSPYSVSWNSTGVSNGNHTVTAVARDSSGNTTTSSGVVVNVNNTTTSPHDKTRANSYDDAWQTAWVNKAKQIFSTPISGITKTPGKVIELGDSMTFSMAYGAWANGGQGQTSEDLSIINWMYGNVNDNRNGWYLSGAGVTANSSAGWGLVDTVLNDSRATDAKIAVLMFNTPSSNPSDVSLVQTKINQLIAKGILPVLSTIPPRTAANYDATIGDPYNNALRALAQQNSLPIIDYSKEILLRRPNGTWANTLISSDGVHPSGGVNGYTAYSDPYASGGNPATHTTGDATLNSGYLLRTWLTIQKIKEIKDLADTGGTVLPTADIKANGSDGPISVSPASGVNLTWTSTNATSCSVNPGGYTGTSGSQTTEAIEAGRTFVLSCSGAGGTKTDSVVVNPSTTGDTTNPTVVFTSPSDNSKVSGSINLSANATDNVGVVGVQFKVNGVNLGSEDTSSPYSVTWDTLSLSNNNYTLTAVARDAAGNTASTVITVTVNNISSTKFVIGDAIKTTTTVNVRESASPTGLILGTQPEGHTGKVTSGPVSGGGYVWWKLDYDDGVDGWTVENYLEKYTTSGDTIKPTVNITAPTSFTVIAGIPVFVSADATDNVGVVGVQFKLDGVNLGSEDTSSPYSTIWDTTNSSEGPHTLTAVARDAAGNSQTSSSVTVTVTKPDVIDSTKPTANITSPANNQEVSGTVTISADATDNVGVVGVQFKLNGVNLNSEDSTSPYSTVWNTETVSNASYTLTAVSRDAAGNTQTSNSVLVRVSNDSNDLIVPPTVQLTAPASGSTVSGSISVSGTATDDKGVSGIQFKLDGVNLLTEDTTAPYSISWDTRSTANGLHTLTAVARDVEGNQVTSDGRTITISNSVSTGGLKIGDRIKTNVWLNVRSTPGGRHIGSQRTGRMGTIVDGPATAKNLTWWKVNFDSGADGWVAGNYISKVTTAMTDEDYRQNIANIYLIIKYLQERLTGGN